MLQCVVPVNVSIGCCGVLQCVAVCCSVLQYVAVCRTCKCVYQMLRGRRGGSTINTPNKKNHKYICLCVCMYIYMYPYIHIYIYIYVYNYVYIYMYMFHAYGGGHQLPNNLW